MRPGTGFLRPGTGLLPEENLKETILEFPRIVSMKKISQLAVHDRPREKLVRLGPKVLSDQELLCVLLGTGVKGCNVQQLAANVIALLDRSNVDISVRDLEGIPGLGPAKASVVVSALEFSRRRISSDGNKISTPEDVIPLISHLADRKQETFLCISLNGAHEVIATRVVTIGLANVCQVHPREVFADPITDRACAVIVAHNHPSGDLTPSEQDFAVTERLKAAASILGIKFLDHLIFSKRGHKSILVGPR